MSTRFFLNLIFHLYSFVFIIIKVGATCGVALASYKQEYYGRSASVVEMDGKLEDINDYKNIETYISATAAKVPGELASELIKVKNIL